MVAAWVMATRPLVFTLSEKQYTSTAEDSVISPFAMLFTRVSVGNTAYLTRNVKSSVTMLATDGTSLVTL